MGSGAGDRKPTEFPIPEERLKKMPKEMEFFTFLLEQYAAHKNTTADKILKTLDEFGLTDFVIGMYEMYHSEAIENAFTDIDRLISQKISSPL